MKFLDYITIGDILFLPKELDKYDTIRYIVTNAACFKSMNWTGTTEDAIWRFRKREEEGSTGLGCGIAIPHAKSECAHDILAVVGYSSDGVDRDSLDHKLTHFFFLCVTPPNWPTAHLRYYGHLHCAVKDEAFLRFLWEAKSPEDILQLLEEFDNSQVRASKNSSHRGPW